MSHEKEQEQVAPPPDGILADIAEPDPWGLHSHGELIHLHGKGATYGFAVEVPINLVVDDDLDIIDLMFFRGEVVKMIQMVDEHKAQTALEELPLYAQNFAVVTAFTDSVLFQGLLEVIDKALVARNVTPPCHLVPVDSSNITGAGYVIVQGPEEIEASDAGVLYVAFGSGLYRYFGVPVEVAGEFWSAESKGSFFAGEIKNNYRFEKVWG